MNLSAPVNPQGMDYLLRSESMPSPKEINILVSESEHIRKKELS